MQFTYVGTPSIHPYKKERGALVLVGGVCMILPEATLHVFHEDKSMTVTCRADGVHDKSSLLSLRGICYRVFDKETRSVVSCDGILVTVPSALCVGRVYCIVCEATTDTTSGVSKPPTHRPRRRAPPPS